MIYIRNIIYQMPNFPTLNSSQFYICSNKQQSMDI